MVIGAERNPVRVVDPVGGWAATVDLAHGAAIHSFTTGDGVELFEPGLPPAAMSLGAHFLASGLAGHVDCLPTIAPAVLADTPSQLPLVDHGAVWSVPWTLREQDRDGSHAWVTAEVDVAGWPLTLVRRTRVRAGALRLNYRLRNTGDQPLPVLWAGHGLLLSPAGSRLRQPGVGRWEVAATSTTWSGADAATLLHRSTRDGVLPVDDVPTGAWLKAYAPWPPDGVWLDRPDLRVHVRSGGAISRWLGLWVTNFGFPDHQPLRHVAIEPSTGDRDSLAECVQRGTAWMVPPQQEAHWYMEYAVHTG